MKRFIVNALHVAGKSVTDNCVVKSQELVARGQALKAASGHNIKLAEQLKEIKSVNLEELAVKFEGLAARQTVKSNKALVKASRLEEAAVRLGQNWISTHRNFVNKVKKAVLLTGLVTVAATEKQEFTVEKKIRIAGTKIQNAVHDIRTSGFSCLTVEQAQAVECILRAAREDTRNLEHWGRVHLYCWKFAALHILPKCRTQSVPDKQGDIVTWVYETGSSEDPWLAGFAPKWFHLCRLTYTRFIVATYDTASTTAPVNYADPKRFVCGSISGSLAQVLRLFCVVPSAQAGRLKHIIAGVTEVADAADWHTAIASLMQCHHNVALCDPAVCEFDELVRSCQALAPYRTDAIDRNKYDRIIRTIEGVALRDSHPIETVSQDGLHDGINSFSGGDPPLENDDLPVLPSAGSGYSGRYALLSDNLLEANACWACESDPSYGQAETARCLHRQNPGDQEDANGPGVGNTERDGTRSIARGSVRRGSGGSDSSNGSGRIGSAEPGTSAKLGPNGLVGDEPREAGVVEPAGLVDGENPACKIATKVGASYWALLPSFARDEAEGVSKSSLNVGQVPIPEADALSVQNAEPVLEAGCARELCAQPVESSARASVGGDNTDKPQLRTTPLPRDESIGGADTSEQQAVVFGGRRYRVPKEAAEALHQGIGVISISWVDAEGRKCQRVCQNGEAANRQRRQRPANDPSQGASVPSTVLPDDQANRACPIERSRPSQPATNGGEGTELIPAGRSVEIPLDPEERSSRSQLRPKSVGHARPGRAARAGNEALLAARAVPAPATDDATPVSEQVLHRLPNKVQSPWRRHEWGYDDRLRELSCSDCHSVDVPPGDMEICRRRRQHSAKLRGWRAIQYSGRLPGQAPITSKDEAKQGLDNNTRRRRRPRRNRRKKRQGSGGPPSPLVVEVDGTQVNSRWSGRDSRQSRVLSAQSVRRISIDNGPEPVQSTAQEYVGHRQEYGEVRGIPPYRDPSQVHTPQWYPHPGTLLPEPIRAVGPWQGNGLRLVGVPTYQPGFVPPDVQYLQQQMARAALATGGGNGQVPNVAYVRYNAHGPDPYRANGYDHAPQTTVHWPAGKVSAV